MTGAVFGERYEIGDEDRTQVIADIIRQFTPRHEANGHAHTRASGPGFGSSGVSVEERAIRYLEKIEPAISGQNGHNRAFRAACQIGPGFDLPPETAYQLLLTHYNPRCEPPWSARELHHKATDAFRIENRRGWLRDTQQFASVNGHATHEPPPDDLETIDAADLIDTHPALREPILDGLLRRGEVMNVIAAPKTGKSWFALGLGVSLAMGEKWLDKFSTRRGRVLLIDNELHAETLASRLKYVAQAMGYQPEDLRGRIDVLPLRGNLTPLAAMKPFFERAGTHYDMIILDAWYRFQGPDDDENSNANVASMYNLLDKYASMTEAAFVCIHHSSKGSQDGKAVTDVGAGAGAQSRAADVHLVLRADELNPDALILESVCRSFPPVQPFTIRREHPLWRADGDVPPLAKKGKKQGMDGELFAAEFADSKPRTRDELLGRAANAGWSERVARASMNAAISDGYLHACKIPGEQWPRFANSPQTTQCEGEQ
jgi:hypothetical protein